MTQVVYQVVEHDGGWAYKSNGVFSEAYPSHDAALKAAKRVATEQTQAGDTVEIEYQDKDSNWKVEHADSHDRPATLVVD